MEKTLFTRFYHLKSAFQTISLDFFAGLTKAFPRFSGARLALAEDASDNVSVYLLDEKNPDKLLVTVGGSSYEVNTDTHTIMALGEVRRFDESRRDVELSESSSEIIQANRLVPAKVISAEPTAVFVHLQGFGEGRLLRARLSNLSVNLKRLNPGSAVIFVGDLEAVKVAISEARKFGTSQKLIFTDTLPQNLSQSPQSHLVVQGELTEDIRQAYPSSARWSSIKQDGPTTYNVFAFGPQANFLQMIALAGSNEEKLRGAYYFFLEMEPSYEPSLNNPNSLSFDAFKEMIRGNLKLLNQFPALPKVTRLLNDAIKVYLISRVTDYNA